MGKLCVYTFRGDYPVPRWYRFAPPRGVGPGLYNLLNYPDKLRLQLVANWDQYCRKNLSKTEEFPLTGAHKSYVETFDFSIVGFLQPHEVLNQHQRTKYWHRRFNIDPPIRPHPADVPQDVQPHEMPYITCLLAAIAERLKRPLAIADLDGLPDYLSRQSPY